MKKFFNSKIFIGIVCFALGFMANHLLTKTSFHSEVLSDVERQERFPVGPEDLDPDKMMDVFQNAQSVKIPKKK